MPLKYNVDFVVGVFLIQTVAVLHRTGLSCEYMLNRFKLKFISENSIIIR